MKKIIITVITNYGTFVSDVYNWDSEQVSRTKIHILKISSERDTTLSINVDGKFHFFPNEVLNNSIVIISEEN